MSAEAIHGLSLPAPPGAERGAPQFRQFERYAPGQEVSLRVLRGLGGDRYLVSLGGERHVVESAVELTADAEIRATVAAVGERLTLRYVGARSTAAASPPSDWLDRLAWQHGVELDDAARAKLRAAASENADPTRLVLCGLFLARLGVPVEAHAAQALLAAQGPTRAGSREPLRRAAADADDNDAGVVAQLAAGLEQARVVPPPAATGEGGGRRGRDEHDEAFVHWALNLPTDASTAHRYATLPLLIDGRLTELEIAMFTPRAPARPASVPTRLVMTLQTTSLGEIRVEATALEDRLSVTISGSTSRAVESLAAGEDALRVLAHDLGWSVDTVGYRLEPRPVRPPQAIVDHVLSAGTVDRRF